LIIDCIENSHLYKGISESIGKALSYLSETDFSKMDGEYEIEGRDIYAMVNSYKTKDLKEGRLEGHRKYIDVQYMVNGSEKMGYAPLEAQKVAVDYDGEKDFMFFEGDATFTDVKKGMFAIFYPTDLHMPGIGDGSEVVKVVVKVKV
jgi:YhcH/YjgK/YiaL family protein